MIPKTPLSGPGGGVFLFELDENIYGFLIPL
jgi:hypothetical protein